jgi:CBS domain-containing protein
MSAPTDIPARTAERLATPVRDIMRPGVITIAEDSALVYAKRAMVRHGVHAVLVVGSDTARPLGWVTDHGLLRWLEQDMHAIAARHAITEPPRHIDPDVSAAIALETLASMPAVTHLVVGEPGRPPQGVVAPMDLVDLVTRP